MLTTFVRRPVLSAVISILLVLLGLLSLRRMPMALFPSVAPPEVNVTVEYTGANAETVTKAAIVPLERAINGVPGMKYMSSDAGNDGVGVVQILFETGTDPDVAAINVQNRVNAVMGELPAEVIRNGVKIAKEENAMLMYLSIHSTNPDHDEKFLYNFADINVLAELKRIHGVGYADILGAKEYAMRVWLKPDKMATYGVSSDDVLDALEESNVEAAPGKIGENSDKGTTPLQYTLRYTGKFNTVEAYEAIPIRAMADGRILKIKDVADVEFGTTYFDVEAKFNGRPAASILLKQLPGSNASEVIEAVKQRLAVIKKETFLPGMDYAFSFDVSRFLDASVHEVRKTLLEAFVLVALVVFLFLQDLRSTLIPVIAVPVSLVGTFVFIQLLGFSLNLITLFALVLAIGIVVDDAIVVVEAVHHKMTHSGLSAREATEQSLGEIGPAILAITLVMGSVFVPLGFIDGPAGIFYRQFALTMAIAIALSGLIALTLTPALCASFLRPHEARPRSALARFFGWFNGGYTKLEGGYAGLVRRTAARRAVTFVLLGGFAMSTGLVARTVPRGFIPEEDQGVFYVSVTSPPGATLEQTKEVVNAIATAARDLEGVESISTLAGTNVLSDGTGAGYGTCLVNLAPWKQRTRSVHEIIAALEQHVSHIHAADLEFFPPPSVPGYGNASGFELRLLDKTGRGDFREMQGVVDQFIVDLKSRPEIASAFTIFNANYPQYTLHVDIDRAAQKGVSIDDALGTLQTLLGSEYATNFIRFGQMYKVMVQARPEYRAAPEQLLRLQVRSDRGELVPLSAFMTMEKSYGVDQTTRYNMYPSAELNGDGKPGVSSGEVIKAIQETARDKLPRGYGIDWAGISRDEVNAGNQGLWVGLIALIFVYLVLAAQYESFLLPASVVLSLPPGVFGAFALLKLTGLENNIYTHIALVVLIGLLGKNAILIVEFAELRCREGLAPFDAVVDAARQRLRPILMTSLAFIVGLLPLATATGAGAIANRTIGTATVGGMVMGTLWGVVLVPGLYLVFKGLAARLSRPEAQGAEDAQAAGVGS
ncbi:efflux RND transporter permease subunit [Polyangium spumosum]|uniref:Efflux RND transporter permease subunit n=1 Tax=Polyangium spumosum TaxID=889282 RepID=A0A6N7PTV7_9BACT|nr:efflux RND transporter permease subunit [Polyangium spumosum]MRG92241.1 efflux RND transporter permease subunit [Polyangium spumosum]